MNMRTLLAAAVAMHTLVTGCARVSNAGSTSLDAPTVLVVDNQSLADMNIYVYNAGQRIRVGFAGGLRKTQITLPRTVMGGTGELQLLADPIGSNRVSVSNRIYVQPGDTVTMIISP